MIGLNTNLVVRYIVQNDPTQSQPATRLIESCSVDDPGFVSIVTLAEITWVLKGAYGASRDEIGDVLENLLSTQALVVQLAEITEKRRRPISKARLLWRLLDRAPWLCN